MYTVSYRGNTRQPLVLNCEAWFFTCSVHVSSCSSVKLCSQSVSDTCLAQVWSITQRAAVSIVIHRKFPIDFKESGLQSRAKSSADVNCFHSISHDGNMLLKLAEFLANAPEQGKAWATLALARCTLLNTTLSWTRINARLTPWSPVDLSWIDDSFPGSRVCPSVCYYPYFCITANLWEDF